MAEIVIETRNLTKIYKLKGRSKQITALNEVNISIKEGEIFGLLGPNGAGKTTLVQILTTLKQPTRGHAYISGINIVKKPKLAKEKVVLMLGSEMLYYRMTGYNNLKFFCQIYNVPNYKEKIEKITEEFGLEKWLNQYVEHFSSGMKMKLALCRTLLLERDILFLDEPTLGLDVKSIDFIANKLKKIKKTIFLTSHNMNMVEKLCNRVAFISNGNILKIGNKDDIKRLYQVNPRLEIEILKNKNQLKLELNNQNFIKDISDTDRGFVFTLTNRDYFSNLFKFLIKYKVISFKEQNVTLEDLFFKFV